MPITVNQVLSKTTLRERLIKYLDSAAAGVLFSNAELATTFVVGTERIREIAPRMPTYWLLSGAPTTRWWGNPKAVKAALRRQKETNADKD